MAILDKELFQKNVNAEKCKNQGIMLALHVALKMWAIDGCSSDWQIHFVVSTHCECDCPGIFVTSWVHKMPLRMHCPQKSSIG